jgi:hypothetical protein
MSEFNVPYEPPIDSGIVRGVVRKLAVDVEKEQNAAALINIYAALYKEVYKNTKTQNSKEFAQQLVKLVPKYIIDNIEKHREDNRRRIVQLQEELKKLRALEEDG